MRLWYPCIIDPMRWWCNTVYIKCVRCYLLCYLLDDASCWPDLNRAIPVFCLSVSRSFFLSPSPAQFVDEGSPKFSKTEGGVTLTLFRCRLRSNNKIWNLSTVTNPLKPGTNSDIDYYNINCARDTIALPPLSGWGVFGKGIEPRKFFIYITRCLFVICGGLIKHEN